MIRGWTMEFDDPGPGYMHAIELLIDNVWKERTLTISKVFKANTVKSASGKLIERPIVAFEENGKRFVLNSGNIEALCFATGTIKMINWIGKKVTVHPVLVSECFGQRNVPAIRIRSGNGLAKPFKSSKASEMDLTGKSQHKE